MSNNEYTDYVLNLEIYYSIEDFGNFSMIKNDLKTNLKKNKRKNEIRVNFPISNNVKEVIMEKNDLQKIYSFIRIYSTDNDFIIVYHL